VYCVTQNDAYSWHSILGIVGQLGKLRPIVNRLGAFSRKNGGGCQPPRRLAILPRTISIIDRIMDARH
jgi:hypothetical protein